MDGPFPTSPPSAARAAAGLALVLLALALCVSPMARAATPLAPAGGSGLLPDPALTYPADGPAVLAALEVGHAHWAGVPCHGTVTPRWEDLPMTLNAQAEWSNLQGQWNRPELNTACRIALNRRAAWDWPKLCSVIVHELGHLMGHDHSDRPDDIMYPHYVEPVIDCASEPEPPSGGPAAPAATAAVRPAPKRKAAAGRTVKRRADRKRGARTGRSSG